MSPSPEPMFNNLTNQLDSITIAVFALSTIAVIFLLSMAAILHGSLKELNEERGEEKV